jgi:hypothetical protein
MNDRALAKETNILYTMDISIVDWRNIGYYFLERKRGREVIGKKKEVSRSQMVVRTQRPALRHKIRTVRLDSIVHITNI